MIGYSVYQRRRVRASGDWQSVPGTIVTSAIVKSESSESTEYTLAVSYRYEVNGSLHTGTRIGFGQSRGYSRKKTAEAALNRYPANSGVMVYFDPADHKDAVLEREASFTTLYLIVGIAALGLGLFILVRSAAAT